MFQTKVEYAIKDKVKTVLVLDGESSDLPTAAKLAVGLVRAKVKVSCEAIDSKYLDRALLIVGDEGKQTWIGEADLKDTPGQVSVA